MTMTPADVNPTSGSTVAQQSVDDLGGFENWVNGSSSHPSAVVGPLPTPPGYAVERELGRGAMGVVYKAHDPRLNRAVALKMVLAGRHAHPKELARFLYEAETIAAIDDPHVVRVYESGVFDGQPYFVMEFVPGGCLHDLLHPDPDYPHRCRPLPPQSAAALVRKLAGGVQAAHDRGLVHRDIKPRNILLTNADSGSHCVEAIATLVDSRHPHANTSPQPAWVPKLADFGLARRLDSLAASGGMAGTPHYMAPEQAQGDGLRVGPASDVWALGVVLYECLTGRPPFPGELAYDVIQRVVEESPPNPRTFNPDVPRDLELVVLKCLEKDPHRRYPTALALAEELDRFLTGEPVKVRPTRVVERCWRWARKRPTVAALTAAVAILLVVGAVVVTVQGEWAKADRDRAIQAGREKDAALIRAEAAEAEAVTQLLHSEWLGYADRVRMAAVRLADGHAAEAKRLLDGCPAEWRGWEHAHLSRLATGGLSIRHQHVGPATVTLLADGRLATSGDAFIRLWQSDHTLGSESPISPHTAVAISPDGTWAAVGTDIGTVAVWDIAAGRMRFTAPSHTLGTAVLGLAFSPTTGALVSVGEDGQVLLSGPDGKPLAGGRKHRGGATCVAWRPDGDGFVTGGADGTVLLWEADGRTTLAVPEPHSKAVTAVAFSPTSDSEPILVTAGPERLVVRTWDGDVRGRPVPLSDIPQAVAVGPDGMVYVGGFNGVVRMFAAEDGRADPNPLRLPHSITGLAVAGKRVLVAAADGGVRSWNPKQPTSGRRLGRTDAPVRFATFTPVGGVLTLSGRRLGLADPASDADWTLPMADMVDTVAVTATGAFVGVAGGTSIRRLAGSKATELLTDPGTGTGLTIDRQGRYAVRGEFDGRLAVWELATTARLLWEHTLGQPVSSSPLARVQMESAAGLVLAAHDDGTLAGYDLATGRVRFTADANDAPRALAMAADSSTLAAAVGDVVMLWTLTPNGVTLRATLEGHAGATTAVAFAPGSDRLVTGGADGTVRVWDAASGSELLVFREHSGSVTTVEFSPAGDQLLSVSADGSACVWDAVRSDPAARRAAAADRVSRIPAAASGPDLNRLRRAAR